MNVLLIVLSTILLSQAAPADKADDSKRVEMAKAIVSQMATGEFDNAVKPFDTVMTKALPAQKLKQVWEGVISQCGPFSKTTKTRTETIKQYHIVFVTTEFERAKLDTKVVFTARNEITGLFFVPAGKYEAPSYVDLSMFDEIEITVGRGFWKMPGTLSLPKGDDDFPVVVLVHGSGPKDRDESIGTSKPFRDLAHGLASRGIAVLRYEKRTRHHRLKMALLSDSITIKEETVDDAAAAVEAVAAHERLDSDKIFVLGHSLGGYVIPRIAKVNHRIAGFITLAGSTRPLEDLVIDQTKYIVSLDGEVTEDEQKYLDDIERQVENVRMLDSGEEANRQGLPLGIPAKYWLDLRDYDPANEATKIEKPMLFLQGDRDYQVTLEDLAGWQKALGDRSDVTFIRYPKLNHLFVEGEGKSTPAEYSTPGNVAEVVVKDIASWVGAAAKSEE